MDKPDIIKEFQRRRKAYFQKSVPAVVLMLVGFLGFFPLKDQLNDINPMIPVLLLVIIGVGVVWWTKLTQSTYRCPACNSVPMAIWGRAGTGGLGFSRGVNLNPDKCSECGAILK
jgi:hypothetical protein